MKKGKSEKVPLSLRPLRPISATSALNSHESRFNAENAEEDTEIAESSISRVGKGWDSGTRLAKAKVKSKKAKFGCLV